MSKVTASQHEKLIQKIFWVSPNPIAIVHGKGNTYLNVNEAFAQYVGLRREEIIGRTPAEIGLVTSKEMRSYAEELMRKGKLQNVCVLIKSGKNRVRSVLFNTKTVRYGRKKYHVSIGTDISHLLANKRNAKIDFLYQSLKYIEKTGIIAVARQNTKHPAVYYVNLEAKKVLYVYPLNVLMKMLDRAESVFVKADLFFYRVRKMPTRRGSPIDIISLVRVPDATAMADNLRQFPLTVRQKEIAVLAANGHSNREIAEKICLSEYTVKDHLKVIFDVVGVRKRSELCPRLLNLI